MEYNDSMLLFHTLTHLPALVGAVVRSAGDVLELGCGEGSTQILHEICEAQDRRLVSADGSASWVEHLAFLRTKFHQILFVSDWEAWKVPDEHAWGVVLVDHAPAERRKVDIERLRRRAQYVVVHDTDEPCYDYDSVLKGYRYRRDFTHNKPHTTVVSDFVPVWT